MRKFLVAGNWKMNGTRAESGELVGAILAGLDAAPAAEILVCPPFVYLEQVAAMVQGTALELGAQDVATRSNGAFTGETSASMLSDVGCRYVIVGHSERRTLLGETDDVIAAKFMLAQEQGLTPVFCVGETLAERDAGQAMEVIARQVSVVVAAAGIAAFADAVVAYEPVWAIGTGRTATPEQAQEVHAGLRGLIAGHDAKIAENLRILYGGSVKGANAKELFLMGDIDGGLIGGASLDAEEFLAIFAATSD